MGEWREKGVNNQEMDEGMMDMEEAEIRVRTNKKYKREKNGWK